MGNGLCVYSCPGPCQRWGGLPDPCLQRLCLFCLQEGSQQNHRVQGKRGRRWDTHPPACLHPHCLPAFSKLGLPSNFVAVDHFVKCRVLAQEPFGVTACEVDRVPRLRRRLVRLRKVNLSKIKWWRHDKFQDRNSSLLLYSLFSPLLSIKQQNYQPVKMYGNSKNSCFLIRSHHFL